MKKKFYKKLTFVSNKSDKKLKNLLENNKKLICDIKK